MIDNTKFLTYNQNIISRMYQHPDFTVCRPKTNNYYSVRHKDFGVKLSLDFRKAMENGKVIGYRHLEINICPHYHCNNYLHNGNDFSQKQAIKTVNDILTYLGIKSDEYNQLNVCNIEFGLNIIPKIDIKNLINGLYFYKKTSFIFPDIESKPYFKVSDTSKEKTIKAYAKGLQFINVPDYGINPNTFRFEVKYKKSRPLKRLLKKDCVTANDMIDLKVHKIFSQEIIKEWEQILLINLESDFRGLQQDEVQYLKNAKLIDFWTVLYRMKFKRYKEKYYKILGQKNNIHNRIKNLIIDKLSTFLDVTFSPQRTPINSEKIVFTDYISQLINCENVTPHQNNKICLVTGLDISMQKKNSKYLCFTGLKHYKENEPAIFKDLEKQYLSENMKLKNIESQFYYIAHNIRNYKTNLFHNRKRFERRNYNQNQLQINYK